MDTTSYYLVETEYVGPNERPNSHFFDIRTEPPLKNLSHEPCSDGWCGTTNDESVTAWGEYETIDAARAAMKERAGETRECGRDDTEIFLEDGVIEVHLVGAYEEMSLDETANWCAETLDEVCADSTDEKLSALAEACETAANQEGYTLSGIQGFLEERRAELQEEADE